MTPKTRSRLNFAKIIIGMVMMVEGSIGIVVLDSRFVDNYAFYVLFLCGLFVLALAVFERIFLKSFRQ